MMAETPSNALLTRSARILCLTAAGMGAIGLAAWYFDGNLMTTYVEGRPAMMPNTAVALVALGVAAAFVRVTPRPPRAPDLLAGALALLVLAVGLATLVEYAFGLDLRIDRLLAPVTAPPYPGRPSPVTATALTLLACALLVRHVCRPRLIPLVQGVTSVAAFIAFVSLVGHLYGTGRIYQFSNAPSIIGVALPSAIALLLVSTGILLRSADTGIMELLTAPRPAGALARRLGVSAIVGIPALGLLTYRAMVLAGLEDSARSTRSACGDTAVRRVPL